MHVGLREDYLNLDFLSLFALEVSHALLKRTRRLEGRRLGCAATPFSLPHPILVTLPAEEVTLPAEEAGQTASPPWQEMEDWIRNKVKGFHFDQGTVGRVLSSVKHLLRS